MTRLQIQTLLHHKDYKRTTTWLNDLTQKQYINRVYNEKNYTDRSKPALYYLAKNGIKYVREKGIGEKEYIERYYQGHKRTGSFQELCVMIANIYIRLLKDYGTTLKFYTQADFPINGVIRTLSPHCGFVLDETSIICQLFQKNVPPFAIEAKVKQYGSYIESRSQNTTPYTLFIVETDKSRNTILRQLKRLYDEEGIVFYYYIARYNEFIDKGIKKDQFKTDE